MDNADLAFFDDMVTCSQHRFNVDRERIYSTGLSAGGLWTTYLSMMRSDVIAAVAPLSGGLIVDYVLPTRRIPVLVTWGGPQDVSNEQNFETFARNLIADLQMGEHPIVTCDHGEGHEWNPLFNPWILDYLFAHTLSGDDRPFAAGLPEVFPAYCEVPSP
jgi:poly(3-hydroxybutyrate) depolymerase